ncbi:nucleolar complex-associated protein 2-like isoform X2 [Triticum urartu]|uniref:nucleolar complex-associated protein 2-like isoform X2 n=1 Tax=Triticum urartu TaxID=4572 RepID=UPI002042D9C8|nr:nucleolar complex-associated protein 2-like isoform X2 [Triticum urartu]
MAKKLGKKARKFAHKHLQGGAKRSRKLRSQFNRRTRKDGKGREDDNRLDGDGGSEETRRNDPTMNMNDDVATLANCLEFPEDENELDGDLSDSDGYLSEDLECVYYSDSDDDNVMKECIVQDDLDEQNNEMRLAVKKQKKKLKKLLDKDPKFANFLEKWQLELVNYESKEDSDEQDEMDSVDNGVNSGDKDPPSDKILTSKTISEWCQLVLDEPKAPALRNLLNAFRDACQFGLNSNSLSMQRLQSTEVFYQIISFVLSKADNIFRALLEISDDDKGKLMNQRNGKKWQDIEPLIKSYLRNSLDLISQLTDNQILTYVLTRLRTSAVYFSAYPSTSRRLLKILIRLWASGDQNLSLSSFLMIREVVSLLPDCLDFCLTKTYNAYLSSSKIVDNRNIENIDFILNCLVELYSLDIQKAGERAVISVGQLSAILRQASKTKGKEDLLKIDNWQYINCINLWVRFICVNYKDCHNLHLLFSSVVQIIRGVAHLLPGMRYLPLRLKLAHMLNELSNCSQMFFPVPSLIFGSLEFREIPPKEQTEKGKTHFSSLLKVPRNMLKSRDFQEQCVLSAIEVLSAHFFQWSYHVSFPEVATIPLILLKRLQEQTTIESLRRPLKRMIDQVSENRDFVQRKREVVSFSPNDASSVESFLQEEMNGDASFTQFYASVAKSRQSRGRKLV